MAALEKQLAKERAAVQDKLAEARDQLETLEDEERAELLASRSGDVRVPSNVPASGVPRSPYVPHSPRSATPTSTAPPVLDAYDCSGLTSMAWGRRASACRAPRARSSEPDRTSPPAPCSRAIWSSTTA